MTGVVNGYAVNQAALASWIKGATVAATMVVTACACDATVFRWSHAAPTASATASVTAIKAKLATAAATARSLGYFQPRLELVGRVNATARCTALAYTLRFVYATVSRTAGATGYALADAEIGAATFAAEATGTIDPVVARPGSVALVATATSSVVGVDWGGRALPSGLARARAEASTRLSGESFDRHDGFVEDALCGATVTVGAGYLERGVSVVAISDLVAVPGRTVQGRGTFAAGATPLATTGIIWDVPLTLAASATGTGVGERAKGATATGAAAATCRAAGLHQNHAAAAHNAVATANSLTPNFRRAGRAALVAAATGEATSDRRFPVAVEGVCTGTFDILVARSNPSTVYVMVEALLLPVPTTAFLGASTAVGEALLVAEPATSNPYDVALGAGCTGAADAQLAGQGEAAATQEALLVAAPATSNREAVALSAACTGTGTGQQAFGGAVAAAATCSAVVYAYNQADVFAPASRSMVVPSENKALRVAAEDRSMRVPA